MSSVNQALYQQLILDHNRHPKNFRKIEGATHCAEGFNPLCGDRYEIFIHLDENRIIDQVGFLGQGCAISKASASMMTEAIKGKSIDEARKIFASFRSLLKGESTDTGSLGKLKIFDGVWKFPARVKCAGISWHALASIVGEEAP